MGILIIATGIAMAPLLSYAVLTMLFLLLKVTIKIQLRPGQDG